MKKALASLKCEDVETAIKQNKGQRESVRGGVEAFEDVPRWNNCVEKW